MALLGYFTNKMENKLYEVACPYCGTLCDLDNNEARQSELICPQCSRAFDLELPAQIEQQASPAAQELTTATSNDGSGLVEIPASQPAREIPYYGYNGWLSFFCAIQIFIIPFFTLLFAAAGIEQLNEISRPPSGLVSLTYVEVCGRVILSCFGIYAAIKLRGLKQGSVVFVKKYLVSRLSFALLLVFLSLLFQDIPSPARNAILIAGLKQLLNEFVFFGIWFSYFTVSKRIKATFPNG